MTPTLNPNRKPTFPSHTRSRSILKTFEVLFWSLFGMLQTSERELRQPPQQFVENDPWGEGVMGPNKLGVWMISGSLEIILGASHLFLSCIDQAEERV